MNASDLQGALRDIHGLDPVSWWPLAPGWWLSALGTLLLLWLLVRLLRRVAGRRRPERAPSPRRPRWQRAAAGQLHDLRRTVRRGDPKQAATLLSELLRRVAIARCGRAACAGLQGAAWLEWLSQHDPEGHDWRQHGDLLLRAPYAPPGSHDDRLALLHMIDAALAWTRPSAARCTRQSAPLSSPPAAAAGPADTITRRRPAAPTAAQGTPEATP